MSDAYSGQCRKIISAFHYQRPLITKKMTERLAASKKWMTLKIPDKGVVSQHDVSDDVRMRAARQPFQHYRNITSGPPDLEEGTLPGRACDGTAALLPALVDPSGINACNGVAEWNFAHGHAIRTSFDLKFAYKSPVICIENWAQQGPDMVAQFFSLLTDEFAKYGPDNYEANLRYRAILHAESNLSSLGASSFNLTTGGWEAPPTKLMSIPLLERYRQYMIGVEDSDLNDDTDMLEIAMPRRDWFAAVADDILKTNGPNITLEARLYTDERSPFFGKSFHEYKNIRCVFEERPMKGYFVPQGSGYNFVEIYDWRNVRGETLQGASDGAGLVAERNPDYWKDSITCGGVTYPVVSFAPMISSKAFERYRLSPSVAPAGISPLGTNFEVSIEEPSVECNPLHNQFFLVAQHKSRFKVNLPKLAGMIAYLPEPQGLAYDRSPCVNTVATGTADATAEYDPLEPSRPDSCETANCVACGDDPVANGQGACVADADGSFQLEPCGNADVVWTDGTLNVVLKVRRLGNLTSAATVDYAVTAGTAVAATHFTDPADATLSWAAGEGGFQTITVPVIGADADDPKTFVVTLSNATGGASLSACTAATMEIQPTG